MKQATSAELVNDDHASTEVETFSPNFETLKTEVIKSIARALEFSTNRCAGVLDFDEKHGVDFYEEVVNFEIELIKQALVHTKDNQRAAARLLGLKTTTLNSKVKAYKLNVDSQAP